MISSFTKTQKIQEELEAIEELVIRKYLDISKIRSIVFAVSKGEVPGKMPKVDYAIQDLRKQFFLHAKEVAAEKLKTIKSKTGKRKKGSLSPKRQKGDSQEVTFQLFESGKNVEVIALERGLASSTIKSHMAEGIASGRFELEDCLPQEVIIEIMASLEKFKTVKELREHFKDKYDYGTLKMVFAGNRDV